MSENNEHINSSAFKKYLSDKTSSAEKEAFEQSLEGGSFEEEALEGFKSLENDAAAIAAINAIDQKIAKRTGRKGERERAFPIWKVMSIAASVIIFLGLGYFLSDLMKTEDNLALNKTEIKEESTEDIAFKDFEDGYPGLVSDPDSGKLDPILEQESIILESEDEEMKPPPPSIAIMDVQVDDEQVEDAVVLKPKTQSPDQNQDFYGDMTENENAETVANTSTIAKDVFTESKKERSNKGAALSEPVAVEDDSFLENNSYLNIAKVNFESKNYNAAINYFQSSIDNRQSVQEATYYIGLSYFKLNKNVKAIKYFDDVIQSNSSWVSSAKWYKILIYEERGDTSSAIELLEELGNGNSAYKNQALDKLKAY